MAQQWLGLLLELILMKLLCDAARDGEADDDDDNHYFARASNKPEAQKGLKIMPL